MDTNKNSLTVGQKLSYGVGTIGYNACWWWVSVYFSIYYTDTIGVNTAVVAALLFFARIFDAIDDPLIGSLQDRTASRWGRYRPWLFAGSVLMPICVILLFSAKSSWTILNKIIWMVVVYFLAEICSTVYDMAYSSLHGVMTNSSKERVSISSFRMVCAQIGTQITGILGMPLVLYFSNAGGLSTQRSYTAAVAIISLATMPLAMWTPIKVAEKVLPAKREEKISVKGQIQTLTKSPPVWIITFGMFAFGFLAYGRGNMMVYYMRYVAGNVALMSVFSIVNLAGTLIGSIMICPLLYGLLHHKGKVVGIAHLLIAAFNFAIFFVKPNGILFWGLTFLASASQSTMSTAQYSMLGDAADYGELKTGLRCDGFLSAFTSTALKIGGAIAPSLGLMLMARANFVPNTVQTSEVIRLLKGCISIMPGTVALFAAILFFFAYKLSETEHERIRKELTLRKAKN